MGRSDRPKFPSIPTVDLRSNRAFIFYLKLKGAQLMVTVGFKSYVASSFHLRIGLDLAVAVGLRSHGPHGKVTVRCYNVHLIAAAHF